MPAEAIVTLVAVGLTVVVLAAYLITVAVILRLVNRRLTAVIASLRAISEKSEPLGPVMEEINAELDGLRSSFARVERAVERRTGVEPSVEQRP